MNIAQTPYVELRKNRRGSSRAYIAGTRVRVRDIYAQYEVHGKSPEDIVASFPHLSLAQVHAALAYYFANREAIVQEIREDDSFVDVMRAKIGPGLLEQRVMARTQTMRLHLDELVDHAIARGLRLRGVDVTTTTDAGLPRASDRGQLAYALRTRASCIPSRRTITAARCVLRFRAPSCTEACIRFPLVLLLVLALATLTK